MAEPPRSSQSTPSDAAVQMLQQGLAALKQRNYSAAVERLAALQQSPVASYRIKAQMGLVRAYAGLKQVPQAVELCQTLAESSVPKVRTWAESTLEKLKASTDSFQASPAPPTPDASGFVPLESDLPPQQTVAQSFTVSEAVPQTNSEDPFEDSSADGPPAPPISPQTSLFHYQTLNQTRSEPEQALPPSVKVEPPSTHPPDNVSLAKPQPLAPSPRSQQLKLWGLEILTAIAFWWVARWLLHRALLLVNWLLRKLQWIEWPIDIGPVRVLEVDPGSLMGLVLLALLVASPWLLDVVLQKGHRQRNLSTRELKNYSSEGLVLVRRICTQHGWQMPELRFIPTATPLCFSYGWHPHNARIVLSQGLLEQFSAEEISSLLAYEMSHLIQWDLPAMSGMAAVLLLLFQGYWFLARRGDQSSLPLVRNLLAVGASLCYGLFWILRKVGLWLSRHRSYRCDRTTVQLTGQPELHRQCLTKLTFAIANTITQQKKTPALLESLDLLMPVSHRLALSPGSSADSNTELEALLGWDYQNPYRSWLQWNLPHVPTGARLQTLGAYAATMGIAPGTSFVPDQAKKTPQVQAEVRGQTYLPPLLLQGSPVVGAITGAAIAMVLWFLGGLGNAFNWFQISWFYQDGSVLKGLCLVGFGVGLMMRINRYFPEITPSKTLKSAGLSRLHKNSLALPIDSQAVRLQGQLLGRTGIANWLCQDLILETPTGLVRLHILSGLGPVGNFSTHRYHPVRIINRDVIIEGWFRHGPTVWIDVMNLKHGKYSFPVSHIPLWSTIISLLACTWGIVILLRGY